MSSTEGFSPDMIQRTPFQVLCQSFAQNPDCLQLFTDDGVRGVQTSLPIQPQQVIISIPYKYTIHPKINNKRSPLLQYIDILSLLEMQAIKDTKHHQLRDRDQLHSILNTIHARQNQFYNIIYLLEERFLNLFAPHFDYQVEGIHQIYINLLPRTYSYHPGEFAEEILPFHQKIHEGLTTTNKNYSNIQSSVKRLLTQSFMNNSFQQFLNETDKKQLYYDYLNAFSPKHLSWASRVLQTRQFDGNVLVPLLDLFNHSEKCNSEWSFDDESKMVTLIANKLIEANQEITVSYGSRTMQELFRVYGFFSEKDLCEVEIPSLRKGQSVKFQHKLNSSISTLKCKIQDHLKLVRFDSFIVSCKTQEKERKAHLANLNAYLKEDQQCLREQILDALWNLSTIIEAELKLISQIMSISKAINKLRCIHKHYK